MKAWPLRVRLKAHQINFLTSVIFPIILTKIVFNIQDGISRYLAQNYNFLKIAMMQ